MKETRRAAFAARLVSKSSGSGSVSRVLLEVGIEIQLALRDRLQQVRVLPVRVRLRIPELDLRLDVDQLRRRAMPPHEVFVPVIPLGRELDATLVLEVLLVPRDWRSRR